jgi:NTE family protein
MLHLIHTDLEVKDLSASSKLNAEWSYLRLLFGLGRKWAGDWLAENYERIGVASTIDLDELFGETGPLTPRVEAPAREA